MNWAVLLLASLAFVLAGAVIFFNAPGGRVAGAVVVVIFGIGALWAVYQLVVPAVLVLDSDGYTVETLGLRRTRRWSDIESFTAISMGRTSVVSANGRDGKDRGVLPYNFGMSSSDLADLMNRWRERYRADAPGN